MNDQQVDGYDERVGRNVQELRKARGFTQSELAEMVTESGIPFRQQTIVKIEKGQRPLRLQEAAFIASALEVDLDVLDAENAVVDKTSILLHQIQRLNKAWAGLTTSVSDFMDARAALRSNLEWFAPKEDSEEPRVNDHVLNEAATLQQADPVAIVRSAMEQQQLAGKRMEALMVGAVDAVSWKEVLGRESTSAAKPKDSAAVEILEEVIDTLESRHGQH